MWAGQANALPAASAFLPLLNFSLHAELITVVSDVCVDILLGIFSTACRTHSGLV